MTDAADIEGPPSSVPDPMEVPEDLDAGADVPVAPGKLFRICYPIVREILERVPISTADANDICQQVVFRTWERHEDIPARRLKGWLIEVTRRKLANYWRRAGAGRDDELPGSDRDGGGLADPGLDPEQTLSRAQDQDFLRAILDAMQPRDRIIFCSFELEEMSYREIAAAHGVSEDAIDGRIRRARSEFKAAKVRVTAMRARRGAT
jgi:RNA polymerase sigma factor (sigma-70 family)